MAILIQYANGVPGVKFLLDKNEITIGRGLDNDISIDDEFVSKQHAVIHLIEDELTARMDCILIDNNSTNHTYINNTPITAHRLDEHDKIFIGQNEFRFLPESPVAFEFGSTVNGFIEEAPGLMHAKIMGENAERDTSKLFQRIPLRQRAEDELTDTKCQLQFANEPVDALDQSADQIKKRFSRRLSLL